MVYTTHLQFVPKDIQFLTNNTNAVVNAGTDEVIFLHHSTGSDVRFDLFTFSIKNSKTDSWVFMLVTHGNAPFVLNGSKVMILNHSQATVDYSQFVVKMQIISSIQIDFHLKLCY